MGVKLKALRPAVGTYGRVSAGGIVEVEEAKAAILRKTGRFVTATAADIAQAQQRQREQISAVPMGYDGWPSVTPPAAETGTNPGADGIADDQGNEPGLAQVPDDQDLPPVSEGTPPLAEVSTASSPDGQTNPAPKKGTAK